MINVYLSKFAPIMADGLKSKAIEGARWGFIENFSSLAVTFIVGIFLARILSPQEYGLIGSITIFIYISISFIDNGLSSALIKKREPDQKDFSTVFLTNLGISIICFVVLYFLSEPIASFFNEAELTKILRVLSIVLIINALSIVQRTLLVKSVDFKRLTLCSLSSAIISGVVGIYMALKGYGVWALVGQQISKQFVNTIMLWIVGSWSFSFSFSFGFYPNRFKELFSYGSKILVSGLLDTLFKYLYYPIIGKFFSNAQLGQYTRADQFSNVTSNNISQIIQRVSFPILSQIQDDNERLRNSFRTIVMVCALLSSFLCFWLSGISHPLIIGLIGSKWTMAANILQIISLGGVFVPLHYLNQNILQVKGRMREYLALEIFKKILIILSVIAGIALGLNALLWGFVIANTLTYIVFSYFSGKYLNYNFINQFFDILRPMLLALLSAIVCGVTTLVFVWLSKNYLNWYNPTWTNIFSLILGSAIGSFTLYLLYKIFPGKEFKEAIELAKFWKKKGEKEGKIEG